jgi:hypothetical protein
MKHIGFGHKTYLGVLMSAAAVVFLVGCGSTTATTSVTSSPLSTPTAVDVAGAQRASMGLFVEEPSLAGHWISCPWDSCPISAAVRTRLNYLNTIGFGGDIGGCGEDYITHTQNGLFSTPKALSAVAGADGTVTVVIQRDPSGPNLTAVMSKGTGAWLATDLASGTGPNASIFSAKPNC